MRSHGEVDSDQRSGRVRLRTPTLETTMPAVADRPDAPTAIQTNLAAMADPGGRTDSSHGLKCRSTEWFRPPEPLPAASGILVQPSCAATVCEVDRARKRAASCKRARTSDTETAFGV